MLQMSMLLLKLSYRVEPANCQHNSPQHLSLWCPPFVLFFLENVVIWRWDLVLSRHCLDFIAWKQSFLVNILAVDGTKENGI